MHNLSADIIEGLFYGAKHLSGNEWQQFDGA